MKNANFCRLIAVAVIFMFSFVMTLTVFTSSIYAAGSSSTSPAPKTPEQQVKDKVKELAGDPAALAAFLDGTSGDLAKIGVSAKKAVEYAMQVTKGTAVFLWLNAAYAGAKGSNNFEGTIGKKLQKGMPTGNLKPMTTAEAANNVIESKKNMDSTTQDLIDKGLMPCLPNGGTLPQSIVLKKDGSIDVEKTSSQGIEWINNHPQYFKPCSVTEGKTNSGVASEKPVDNSLGTNDETQTQPYPNGKGISPGESSTRNSAAQGTQAAKAVGIQCPATGQVNGSADQTEKFTPEGFEPAPAGFKYEKGPGGGWQLVADESSTPCLGGNTTKTGTSSGDKQVVNGLTANGDQGNPDPADSTKFSNIVKSSSGMNSDIQAKLNDMGAKRDAFWGYDKNDVKKALKEYATEKGLKVSDDTLSSLADTIKNKK